jgi:hypothetical protein
MIYIDKGTDYLKSPKYCKDIDKIKFLLSESVAGWQ